MLPRTRAFRREILKPAFAGLVIGLLLAPLPAQGERVVRQVKTAFMPSAVEVVRGGSLAITNDDPFLHHVFVESPGFRFDSGEQKPGETIIVRFTVPGRFVAQCAIHLKMRLTVDVR
jgi:plastocyanin